jgi:Type VI secretion system effector, Hcp
MPRILARIPSRLVLPALVAALIAMYAAGVGLVAGAAEPVTFFACLDANGSLSSVATSPLQARVCGPTATVVSWSQAGPQGAPGPMGPAGPAGPQGPAGPGGGGAPSAANKAVAGRVVIDGLTDAAGVEIVGFKAGVKMIAGTGSGGGGGKAQFDEVTVVTALKPGAAPLFQKAVTGQHVKVVTVTVFQAGSATPAATYKLTDALITSVADGHTGAQGDGPLRTITFSFAVLEVS